MTTHQDTSTERDLVANMRVLEADHEPDGWPAVRMSTISALCDEIERLRAALASRDEASQQPQGQAVSNEEIDACFDGLMPSGCGKSRYDIARAILSLRDKPDQFPDAAKMMPVSGWQPIETAPKDGTQIILTNGVSVAQGEWLHQEPYARENRDLDGRYISQDEFDGFDGWIDFVGGMLPEPTHWQPLPPPPNGITAKEQGNEN